MSAPTCLIDASIYIFRFYFAMPEHWYSVDSGYPTEAVYGYTSFLLKLLNQSRPTCIAACFDESLGTGFRHELYPQYKASRALADEGLAFQLKACQEVTALLGISTFSSKVYEADDLLGSLHAFCQKQHKPIAVLTRDKDLGQLIIRPQDYLWDYAADNKLYTTDITKKFGVKPSQLVDYLALVGDAIDDIPGVPGVGAKTASILLNHFTSLENIFLSLEQVECLPIRGAKVLGEKLAAHIDQIFISQQLARIICDIPLVDNIQQLQHKSINVAELVDFFEAMGWSRNAFKQLLSQQRLNQ